MRGDTRSSSSSERLACRLAAARHSSSSANRRTFDLRQDITVGHGETEGDDRGGDKAGGDAGVTSERRKKVGVSENWSGVNGQSRKTVDSTPRRSDANCPIGYADVN